MKAREFLAKSDPDLVIRNLIKAPLTSAELREFAKRVGGPIELVAPKRRAEVEGLTSAQIIGYLAEDGNRVRRPIIDDGERVYLGFSMAVQAELGAR